MREGIVSLTDTIWRVLPVDYWDGRMIDVIGDNFVPSPDESLAQLGRLQTLLGDMRMARRSGGTHADEQAWLHQARKLLDSRLTESRPDLYAAAAAMGCGYHTFRRRFVQLAGIGPAQYRLHSQINLAQALMIQHPSLSNKELAERCGFGDEFHFSKQFKRVTQLSPRQFREKCRAGRIGAVE
jgi:AraC-like DNA-binding protein